MAQNVRKTSFRIWMVMGVAAVAFVLLFGTSDAEKAKQARVLGVQQQRLADKGSEDSGNKSGGVSSKPERLEQHTKEKTEVKEQELENEDLEHINKELEDEDVHVGSSAGVFTITHGEVKAETHFPLSVNAATHQLTVKTPAGTKTVTVLPDQAVKNLLSHNIFDRIEGNVASPGAQKIALTQMENQAVFAVNGLDDKRLLGFIPIAVRKTAFVSAQNGGVVRTDEDLVNKLLDALSF